jgi:hypothetical protein
MWRKEPKHKAAPAAAKRSNWHAVEVVSPKSGCPAAQALKGQRFLSAEAPLLPLPDCIRSALCGCLYRKYADRRTESRRENDDTPLRRTLRPAQDRRTKRGRRRSD